MLATIVYNNIIKINHSFNIDLIVALKFWDNTYAVSAIVFKMFNNLQLFECIFRLNTYKSFAVTSLSLLSKERHFGYGTIDLEGKVCQQPKLFIWILLANSNVPQKMINIESCD